MDIFLSELKKVSICGVLPLFVCGIFIILIITVACMKSEKIIPLDEFSDKRKNHKIEKMFSQIDLFSKVYFFICLNLAMASVVASFNHKYYIHIPELINKIEIVGSNVLGLTTIAVTLSVAIILFDRRYYIVFSVRDVLQKYKFADFLSVCVFSCVIVVVLQITLINQSLDSNFDLIRFMVFEIAVINNICSNTYVLYSIIQIMFFEQRKELGMLRQLYRCFLNEKIDTLSFKEKNKWNKEAIEINIKYLFQQYDDICRKKKILRIDYIEFATTLGIDKKKWYIKARNKFIKLNIICLIVSILIDIALLKEKCIIMVAVNLLFAGIIIGITFLKKECIYLVILKLIFDTWGYYMHKDDDAELFIPRVALIKSNIYNKFIMRMNSLNAFFYLWINYIDDDSRDDELVKEMYQQVTERIELVENRNWVTYMPVFIVGFFLYQKNIKESKTREIYKKIVGEKDSIYFFQRMLYSQIFYLSRNNSTCIKDVWDYLLWLQQQDSQI